MPHLLTVSPSPKRNDNDVHTAGRFDARYGDRLLVERTRTPFCDGARAMLAQGLADPSDRLVMRHAGSETDALAAKVGVAAKLTVDDASTPRFHKWVPRSMGDAPMRESTVPVSQAPPPAHALPEPSGYPAGCTGA
jgi:hypothetical protein